jgi:hypothetical protein
MPPGTASLGDPASGDGAGGHTDVVELLGGKVGESPRKIGSGVSHFEAGIFSGANGSGGRKIGGCHAIAPAWLAGMSDQ